MAGVINNALDTGTTPIPVTAGGTGVNTVPTNGQIPIGNGTNYVAASITAGAGITLTPGAGSLTIAASGSGGLAWSGIAGTTQAAAVNSGYVVQNAGQTTVTLPDTAVLGNIVSIVGMGAAGWILQAPPGVAITLGGQVSGAGGTWTSAGPNDCVDVVCAVDALPGSGAWTINNAVSSGLTPA